MANFENRPCVSGIMATLNEVECIEIALRSLLEQSVDDFELEILVIDGMSADGTREKAARIAEAYPSIKLLDNPKKTAPAAFNIGLQAAKGEYVCILGAHTFYPKEYLLLCLHELLAHDAVGCSGKVVTRPPENTVQARLVAWTIGHRFASSGHSVRTQPEGYVDTVPFPLIRKQALLQAGGYDESLIRNQDNDMNQRLRKMGYRLFLTAKTSCFYFSRPDIKSLLKHAWRSGSWNAITLTKRPASMSLRHFVPFLFVSTLLLLAMFLLGGLFISAPTAGFAAIALVILISAHWTMGLLAGIEVCLREHACEALLLPAIIFLFHIAYGTGTLAGFLVTLGESIQHSLSSLLAMGREFVLNR